VADPAFVSETYFNAAPHFITHTREIAQDADYEEKTRVPPFESVVGKFLPRDSSPAQADDESH